MFANQDEPDKSACALEIAEALQLRQVNHRLQQEIAERILIERQLAASRQALEQQLQWMRLLRHITDNIRANLSTEHIVQTAARELGQALEVSRCLIHAYKDAPQPHLVPVAEYLAVGVLSLAGKPVPFENNPHFDKVIGQDRAVVTDCCADEPMLAARQEQRQVSGVKSIMAVRTSYQGQINGAIGIHQCDRVRSWQNEEIQLVEAVAAQVGIALAQVQLLEQERRGREQLAWQANHDSLTKLLNRHAFEQHLAVAVKSAHRHGYRHALCFLDIDQFKIVNDICGHRAGDELLKQITALLIAHLQASDTLARLGGDEFGLLLFECSPESARQFIEHLLERMSRFRFS
ncbi:MAG: sensor domain-containing diguanylate cyclase, partial [Gemmatimonadaceae bacterium]|nr:sensor domain-containing diguanylate cyclase [Gloeobacterales cyanobacterium ES-bin-141]